MSLYSKYGYLVGFIIIIIFIVIGAYSIFDNPNEAKGMPITFEKKPEGLITYYDNDLPINLNYSQLMIYKLKFIDKPNDSTYTLGPTPEQNIHYFNDTKGIKTWLDMMEMPNIVRNMVKAILDMSNKTIDWFSWGDRSYIEYYFNKYKIDDEYTVTLRCSNQKFDSVIWEIVFKLNYVDNDFFVTFMRYPKP